MKLFHLTLAFAKHPTLKLDHQFFHQPPRYFVHQEVDFFLISFDPETSQVIYREHV